LLQEGIKRGRYQKYSLNKNYFNQIDTPEKAYFLGFITADGTVSKNGNKCKIALHEKDSYILEEFKKELNYEKPLYKYPPRGEDNHSIHELIITCQQIVTDLSQYGIIPRKTYDLESKVPNINFIEDYVRGFFDGDGGVTRYQINRWKKPYMLVAHFTCNIFYLKSLQSVLYQKGFEKLSFRKVKGDLFGRLSIYRHSDLQRLYELMYTELSAFLKRKKDIFDFHFNNSRYVSM
jgi:hypothetical protein